MAPLKMFNMPFEQLKALATLEGSGVDVKEDVDVVLQIHPMYSTDIQKGVAHELDVMSSRYSKTLGGIPLGYEKVRISQTGGIMHTSPYIHLRVWANFCLFSPVIGMSLEATVRKKSLHHLSCLVHNVINVSVPRPQDVSVVDWEGSHVEEGGKIYIRLTNIDMAFYLPMITGKIERVHDSQETSSKLVDISLSKEKGNSRITFGDSGISSDEELGKPDKKKNLLEGGFKTEKEKNNDGDANSRRAEKDKKKKKKKSQEISMAVPDPVPGTEKSEIPVHKKKKRKSSFKDSILENPCSGSENSETEEKPKRKEKKFVETFSCTDVKGKIKKKDYYGLPEVTDNSAESSTEPEPEKKKTKKKKNESLLKKNTFQALTIKSEPLSPVKKREK